MRLDELFIASGNANKVQEIENILGVPVHRIEADLPEVQAVEVEDVIGPKARAAHALIGRPVLVEDTGLFLHAWNGLPGALIRWFLGTVGNEGVCRMLDGFDDRGATARTCLAIYDGEQVHVFSGEVTGRIADHPRGEAGFGWDKIFIPEGWDQTFAETGSEKKDAISMRKRAVEELRAWLEG